MDLAIRPKISIAYDWCIYFNFLLLLVLVLFIRYLAGK